MVEPKGTVQMQRKWLKLDWPRLISFTYNSDITTSIPDLLTRKSSPRTGCLWQFPVDSVLELMDRCVKSFKSLRSTPLIITCNPLIFIHIKHYLYPIIFYFSIGIAVLHQAVVLRPVETADFCPGNSMQFFLVLKLQLQNCTCKPGAIFSAICRRDTAGVSNMFETWCNFTATKIASSCCDKYRLCKRAFISP